MVNKDHEWNKPDLDVLFMLDKLIASELQSAILAVGCPHDGVRFSVVTYCRIILMGIWHENRVHTFM